MRPFNYNIITNTFEHTI